MSTITWFREASATTGASWPFSRSWWRERRQDESDAARAQWLAQRFTVAVANLGLARHTESCAGLPGIATPVVRSVRLGDVERLLIEVMPGQTVATFRAESKGLAEALGCHHVRISRRGPGYVHVEVQRGDALDQSITLPGNGVRAIDPLLLGRLDDGKPLTATLADQAHILVQGQTRSGKSRFLYGLLSQVSDAPDVLICGSDISALVLRPFAGTRHGQLIACGSADIDRHVEVLEELVDVMDDRISRIPPDEDVYPCGPEDPYLVTLIEELPGLLRRAGQADVKAPCVKGSVKRADRIKAAYGRLLAEGAKAGFRLVIVMQRADALIIGGYERAQCPLRISFAVDDRAAVKMLHPAASDDLAEWHCSALPGRALVSMPGLPIGRFRSPDMDSYRQYVTNVLAPIEPASDPISAARS
jgi:hypothetical protein